MIDATFEIFKAGTHRDMSGAEVTVDPAGLGAIAAAYNHSQPGNEAVLTIGHPANDRPVLGTVRRLFALGETLLAEAQAGDALRDAVRAGRYRKVRRRPQIS